MREEMREDAGNGLEGVFMPGLATGSVQAVLR
jgi:hypothetical protein